MWRYGSIRSSRTANVICYRRFSVHCFSMRKGWMGTQVNECPTRCQLDLAHNGTILRDTRPPDQPGATTSSDRRQAHSPVSFSDLLLAIDIKQHQSRMMSPQLQQQHQGVGELARYQYHYSKHAYNPEKYGYNPESQGYPMFSHDHREQQQQHDAFAWQQHLQQQHHQQHYHYLPEMTYDPLPTILSSNAEHQRASVSIDDEIFEARMLEEALRDCEAHTAVQSDGIRHHNQQHLTSPLLQLQSFQEQVVFPSQFASVTTPNNALRRGSLTQQVLSPVENLRSCTTQHQYQQPMAATSPSSYSSSSSTGSPVVEFASLLSHTLPPSLALSAVTSGSTSRQAQPKKRVQTARICQIDGCTRGIRSRGLCKAHGGGRRCTTPGCTTSDQGGGHCVLHGGGRRCIVDGCMKSAQWRGVCKLHGGARRCRYGDCIKNGQVKQGYCRLHYNLITRQRLEGLLLLTDQQEGQSQAGSGECDEDQDHGHKENKKQPLTLESNL